MSTCQIDNIRNCGDGVLVRSRDVGIKVGKATW